MTRKLPRLDHVKFVRRKFGGKEVVYPYFNTGQTRDGKPIYKRMPLLSDPGFFASYAAFRAGRTKRASSSDTFTVADLIDRYLSSGEYKTKADGTQRLYRIQLGKAMKLLDDVPANELTAADVEFIMDREGWSGPTQNSFTGCLGAAYKWGRKSVPGITAEPTKGIGQRAMGTHEPWPADILAAALECENDRVRLAAHLLYFTGQRIGDVCAMRWGQIKDGYVSLTQQKTGTTVTFPVSGELLAELERTPKRGIHILTDAGGKALKVAAVRMALTNFTNDMGAKCVPHGLRKNAVNSLLEAGCTIHEVSAVTGQSLEMIEHYAKRVDRKKLGAAAMLKFDASRRKSS